MTTTELITDYNLGLYQIDKLTADSLADRLPDHLITIASWNQSHEINNHQPEIIKPVKKLRLDELVSAMVNNISLQENSSLERRTIVRAFIYGHFPKCITNKKMGQNLALFFSAIRTNQPIKPTVARLLSTTEKV